MNESQIFHYIHKDVKQSSPARLCPSNTLRKQRMCDVDAIVICECLNANNISSNLYKSRAVHGYMEGNKCIVD